ncbi:hypothetical protein MMC21_008442 [Puttea exsequens]|nr:hypothetical protein [Puttea exsequens]
MLFQGSHQAPIETPSRPSIFSILNSEPLACALFSKQGLIRPTNLLRNPTLAPTPSSILNICAPNSPVIRFSTTAAYTRLPHQNILDDFGMVVEKEEQLYHHSTTFNELRYRHHYPDDFRSGIE